MQNGFHSRGGGLVHMHVAVQEYPVSDYLKIIPIPKSKILIKKNQPKNSKSLHGINSAIQNGLLHFTCIL